MCYSCMMSLPDMCTVLMEARKDDISPGIGVTEVVSHCVGVGH